MSDLAYKIEKMRSHGIVKDSSEFELIKKEVGDMNNNFLDLITG